MPPLINTVLRKEEKSTVDTWTPEVSFGQGVSASIELATSVTRDLLEYNRQQSITSGVDLTPDQIEQKYPFIEKRFNDPVPEDRAKYMNEIGERRFRLNQLKEKGLGTGISAMAIDFASGIGTSLSDPIELAVNIGTGFGVAALGKQLAKSTATTMAARLAIKASKNKTVMELAENTLGSVILEPGYAVLQNKLQREYTLADSALNVVVGSTAFTGIKLGAKQIWKHGKGNFTKLSNKLKGAELDENLSRVKNGLPIDDSKTKQAVDELNAAPKQNIDFDADTVGYVHSDWGESKILYSAYDVNNDVSVPFAHYFGDDLLYATTDPNRANTLTNSKYTDNRAIVRKFDISEMNIMDADEGFETAVGKLQETDFFQRLEADGLVNKFGDDLNKAKSFDDFLTKVREGIDEGTYTDDDLLDVMQSLSDVGFDGIKMTVDGAGNPHHGVFIFPEKGNKAKILADYKPKADKYPNFNTKYTKSLDNELDKEVRPETPTVPQKPFNESEFERQVDDALETNMETMTSMDQEGVLPDRSKKVLEDIKEKKKDFKAIEKRTKNYIKCLKMEF